MLTNEPIDSNGWLRWLDYAFDHGIDGEDPEAYELYLAEGRAE